MDVLVVSSADRAMLGREAAEASVLLGRPVEIRRYSPEKLRRQVEAGNAVLRRILDGSKRWIVGDEARLGGGGLNARACRGAAASPLIV